MARGSGFNSILTDDDKEQLNAVVRSLEAYAKANDNKLAASIVVIVRDHLRKGRSDAAALYLAKMLHEINALDAWYGREVNVDFGDLRNRILRNS